MNLRNNIIITNNDLDIICRKIIRILDRGHNCIICGKHMFPIQLVVVCHFFKRRHLGTRWELTNLHLGHMECNEKEENCKSYKESHYNNFIDRVGIDEFERLKNLRMSNVKLSTTDKTELYNKLSSVYKEIKI